MPLAGLVARSVQTKKSPGNGDFLRQIVYDRGGRLCG